MQSRLFLNKDTKSTHLLAKHRRGDGITVAESMQPAWAKEQHHRSGWCLSVTRSAYTRRRYSQKNRSRLRADRLSEHHQGPPERFYPFSGLSSAQGGEHLCEMTWLSRAQPRYGRLQNSISVDQYAAGKLGYVTRFPSVSLSSDTAKSQSYTSKG